MGRNGVGKKNGNNQGAAHGARHSSRERLATNLLFLVLLSTASCARWDVREMLPPTSLETAPIGLRIGVATYALGALPPPPSMQGGPGGWLPEPLGELAGNIPLLSTFTGTQDAPWMRHARAHDLLSPALARVLLSDGAPMLVPERAWYLLSDDAAAMAAARKAGLDAVLVIHASVGPEEAGGDLPRKVSASAQVSLLDARTGETLAQAYDRVTERVEGGLDGALTRAGRHLGQRLRPSMGWGAGAGSNSQDDEE